MFFCVHWRRAGFEHRQVFPTSVHRRVHSMIVGTVAEQRSAPRMVDAGSLAEAVMEAGLVDGGAAAPPARSATAEPPLLEDARMCRICFDSGGADLIAPCHCDGSVKWVHRSCLDRWRVDGANSRAFTNCPQCGFSYLLVLQRAPTESEQHANERRRQLLRATAREFVMVSLAVQIWLCLLALNIRAADPEETLVKLFGLPQVEGAPEEASFLNSLRYHKSTYYLAAIIVSAFLVGLGTVVFLLSSRCGSRGRTGLRARLFDDHTTPVHVPAQCVECCCDSCRCCCDCLECCEPRHCPTCSGLERSDCCKSCDCPTGTNNCECRECGGLLAVIAVILVVIGVFVALVAAVAWLHKVIQRFFQLRELRVLTGEYVVQDLSEYSAPQPSFLHASAPPQMELPDHGASGPPPDSPVGGALSGLLVPYAPVTAPDIQQSLSRDLQAVYGLRA